MSLKSASGLPGPSGSPGPSGNPGNDGQSAYDVAVSQGFIGTQAQWLASLVGSTGATGSPGASGIVPIYNSAGLLPGVKVWIGNGTTNSSGQIAVNYSSAGFTNVLGVIPHAIAANATLANAPYGYPLAGYTSTAATLQLVLPNAISLLGILPLQTAGAGINCIVFVFGT
jgi:hypothetical protein